MKLLLSPVLPVLFYFFFAAKKNKLDLSCGSPDVVRLDRLYFILSWSRESCCYTFWPFMIQQFFGEWITTWANEDMHNYRKKNLIIRNCIQNNFYHSHFIHYCKTMIKSVNKCGLYRKNFKFSYLRQTLRISLPFIKNLCAFFISSIT